MDGRPLRRCHNVRAAAHGMVVVAVNWGAATGADEGLTGR